VVGVAHGEAERLGRVAAGDATAVVVGEHHDRAPFEAGIVKLPGTPPKSFHWNSLVAVDDLLISHVRRRVDAERLSAPHSVPLVFRDHRSLDNAIIPTARMSSSFRCTSLHLPAP
jgi:hypothetical protein